MIEDGEAKRLLNWLKRQGLEQYAAAFAENDVDLDVLIDLADDDLRELGVSLGHRKRLLRALAGGIGAEPVEPVAEAERRQGTFIFCDLAGATDPEALLDAEDAGIVTQSWHACCRKVVARRDGSVLNAGGESVFIGFGHPRAHEDDAERAVRTALDLMEEVARLRPLGDLRLKMRAGIATGRVVTGGPANAVSGEPPQVTGSIVNLAARLKEDARAGQILIGEATRRLVPGLFELEPEAPRALKGFDGPVEVWRVTGARDVESRFDAAQGHAAMVGRERELDFLSLRWRRARDGAGQVVLVRGEPGIGKSRLAAAFRERLKNEPHTRLSYHCDPHLTNSALHPVIRQIERAAGFAPRDAVEAKLAKIEALADEPEDAALIAALLSVPAEGRLPDLGLTAAQQRSRTFDMLERGIVALAAERPVLMLFEDAHWSDPTTLELLERILHGVVRELPVLAIVAHRLDFDPGWSRTAWIAPLTLDRLDAKDSQTLISGVMRDLALPAALLGDIVRRADGVPLFVEELTKAVMETRSAGGPDGPDDAAGGPQVPASLEDSLMSRLDRLENGKQVAQIASAIGRAFSVELLSMISGLDPAAQAAGLAELTSAGLIAPDGKGADEGHVFKHALVQDAAYRSLLRTRRRALHAAIADTLAEMFPEVAETEPETLAYHCARAERPDEAIRHLTDAGLRATARGAQVEAVNHFEEAVSLLSGLPESPERAEREARLRIAEGAALIAIKGYCAPDVEEAFRAARDLSLTLDDDALLCPSLYGLWVVNLAKSNREETLAFAEELRARFAGSADPIQAIGARFAYGNTLFYQGEHDDAVRWLESAVDIYEPAMQERLIHSYSDDVAQFALVYLQWLHTLRDEPEKADAAERRAGELAAALADSMSAIRLSSFTMMRRHHERDIAGALRLGAETREAAIARNYPFWLCNAQIGHGWARVMSGDLDGGIAEIEEGLGFFDLIAQKLPLTYWRTFLIDALREAGRREEGLSLVDDTLALSRANVDCFYEAEILRLRGELLLLAPADPEAAEARFRQSIELAQAQGVALLERRARDSLERLASGRASAGA